MSSNDVDTNSHGGPVAVHCVLVRLGKRAVLMVTDSDLKQVMGITATDIAYP